MKASKFYRYDIETHFLNIGSGHFIHPQPPCPVKYFQYSFVVNEFLLHDYILKLKMNMKPTNKTRLFM